MDWAWIIGGLLCAWATLRVIGGERVRMVQRVKAEIAANPPTQPELAPPAKAANTSTRANSADRAVRSKAVR